MLFFLIFTKGFKAKLNELESESDIFPRNEGKFSKSQLTPVVKTLTNCAMFWIGVNWPVDQIPLWLNGVGGLLDAWHIGKNNAAGLLNNMGMGGAEWKTISKIEE